MDFTRLELMGVLVHDLDREVERYSRLFGLEFRTFVSGRDYALARRGGSGADADVTLPPSVRMAMDTSGCFELIELPGADEGVRNIHVRVDDIDAATDHLVAHGLSVVHDLEAGTAREVIFDSRDLNGVRLCLIAYEGPSLAEALAASPRP